MSDVKTLVVTTGGTVANDLSRQIGVLYIHSANPAITDTLRASGLVEEVGEDFSWKAFPDAPASTFAGPPPGGGGGPESSADPMESLQWSMVQIRTEQADAVQAGWRSVDVGILDTGIDGNHVDFDDDGAPGGTKNVDCGRGRNSIAFIPGGPGIGNPARASTTSSTELTWAGSSPRRRMAKAWWGWRRT